MRWLPIAMAAFAVVTAATGACRARRIEAKIDAVYGEQRALRHELATRPDTRRRTNAGQLDILEERP